MNPVYLVCLIVVIISFILFLMFHKRLRPTPFWGELHPADGWTVLHGLLMGGPLGSAIHRWTEGKEPGFSALLFAVVYAATTLVMLILAHRTKSSTPKENQSDDIHKQVAKPSNK